MKMNLQLKELIKKTMKEWLNEALLREDKTVQVELIPASPGKTCIDSTDVHEREYFIYYELFGQYFTQISTVPDLTLMSKELQEYNAYSACPQELTSLSVRIWEDNTFTLNTRTPFRIYSQTCETLRVKATFEHCICRGRLQYAIDRTISDISFAEFNIADNKDREELKVERQRLYCFWIKRGILPADIIRMIAKEMVFDLTITARLEYVRCSACSIVY